ncbi:mycothiol synthase [soil metagenome]
MSDSPPPPTPDAGRVGSGQVGAGSRVPAGATDQEAWLAGLIERARSVDGQPPFSDGSLVGLAHGERRLVRHEQSAAIVTTAKRGTNEAEFVVEPDARRHGLGRALLHELLVAAPGDLLLWSHGDHPGARALALHFGLQPVRELLQLRAGVVGRGGVKAGDGAGGAVGEISTSSIREGGRVSIRPAANSTSGGPEWRDAWVELNARAFAGHPEQGAVTRADLDTLMHEKWFDPDDVLLAWDGDKLVGYCWLKVEHDQDDAGTNSIGEFYVVGVAPEWQGRGLGRQLVAAGLARLAERGIREANLYVEGDNAAALRLYRSFGFDQHSIDVQYRWRSEPDD